MMMMIMLLLLGRERRDLPADVYPLVALGVL